MVIAPRLLLLIALAWLLWPVLRAAWRLVVQPEPDRAATLVRLAAERLAHEQPEWAQAMRAEVEHIRGRAERWGFAVGCLHVALLPPGDPGRFGLALRTVVAIAGFACVLAAMYASTQAPDRSIQMNAHDWQSLGVLLLLYGLVTFALSRSRAPAARLAHQVGLIAGIGIGLLMVIGSSPASPISNLNMGGGPTVSPLGYATPLFGCLVIAAAVAWWHRKTSVGVTASILTALVASLVFCVGLITLTYAATSWFTMDPATIASWQSTWSPQHYGEYRNHYDDIATYLIRENGDSAGNCLLLGPLLGLVFGVAGATLGSRAPGAHSGGQPSRRPRGPGWLRWLVTAGGLGAWRVYPYGIALAVELTLLPTIGPDNFDGGAMTWFMLVASGSAASLGLMAGFAVARTTGSIGRGVLIGGLTPLIGLMLADLGVGLGWGTPALPDRIDAMLFSIPVASLCITLGLLCGAVGGALARPHQALRAFLEAQ